MAYQSQNEIPMGVFALTDGQLSAPPSPVHARKYIFIGSGTICNHGFLELLFLVSGSGQISVGEDSYSIKDGQFIVLNAGTEFRYIPDTPLIIYSCSFSPTLFSSKTNRNCCMADLADVPILEGYFQNSAVPFPVCRIDQKYFALFRDVFQKMITLTENGSPVLLHFMRLYIAELLTKTAELFWPEVSDPTWGDADIIRNVLSYIQQNYASRLTYDSLAKMALISRSKLFKLFTEETGQTINDYIKKIRIGQACVLLAETSKSVYDIMLEVGYNDMKMFCRYFKEITEMTPSEYRKLYKKT